MTTAADTPYTDGTAPVCRHTRFEAQVTVNYMEDSGRRMLDVKAHCADCGVAVQFMGVPAGFKFSGPSVSVDGLELSVPICLEGEQKNPMQEMLSESLRHHH